MSERRGTRRPNPLLKPRNLMTQSGRTSVRLEPKLWEAYEEVCTAAGMTRFELSMLIDRQRPDGFGFTSSIRVFLLAYYRHQATNDACSTQEALAAGAAAAADGGGAVQARRRPRFQSRRFTLRSAGGGDLHLSM